MREVDFDINVTPLYDAIGKSDWDAASRVCRASPVQAQTWVVRQRAAAAEREPKDDEGHEEGDDGVVDDANGGGRAGGADDDVLWRFLPLHSSCARRPPSSFLSDLLDAYATAASMRDASGMYPLHYACGNCASKRVIEQLVECFPQAVRESDPQGMLPLHYMAQWGPSEEGIVELLLEVFPRGIDVCNEEQLTPLDLVMEGNFEGWEDVKQDMMTFIKKKMRKKKTKRSGSSIGGGSHAHRNRMTEIENEDDEGLSVSLTSEKRGMTTAPSSTKARRERRPLSTRPIRSSSHSHTETHFDSRDEKPSSRSRSERSSLGSDSRERPPSRVELIARARQLVDTGDSILSSRLEREEESSSPRSSKSSSRSRAGIDVHDEVSPSSRRRYESRAAFASPTNKISLKSIETGPSLGGTPRSFSCSIASPSNMKTPRSSGHTPRSFSRYTASPSNMKTPRSSGHTPRPFSRYTASPSNMKTPRSSGGGPGSRFGQVATRSRSIGPGTSFDFEDKPPVRSQMSRGQESHNKNGSATMSHMSKENESQIHAVNQLSQDNKAQRCRMNQLTKEQTSQQYLLNQLSQDKQTQQQIMDCLSQEKDDAQYRASALQNENMELRAKAAGAGAMRNDGAQLRADHDAIRNDNAELRAALEAMRNEGVRLRAELADRDAIQNENAELRAALAKHGGVKNENARFHAQLAKLQEIQSQLRGVVDIAQQRESARIQASTERRKRVLKILHMEDKHNQDDKANYLYKGNTLERAFEQQVRSIGDLLASVLSPMVIGDGDDCATGMGGEGSAVVHQHYGNNSARYIEDEWCI